jgi:malate dehydrogenase
MAEAYLGDQKRLLPCAARLDGEYGYRGLFLGVPAIIGAGGVERVVEISLSPQESVALARSAEVVLGLIQLARGIA